jgi:predicted permease
MRDWSREVLRRLASLKLAPAREAEIVEEVAQHLEDRYQELVAGGATKEEARRVALEELSDENLLARGLRRVEHELEQDPTVPGGGGRSNLLASIWHDVRYGLRMLRKNPGFTLVAVLTLALGIGATTAIFSVVNGVLLRPLPYPDSDRLMILHETEPKFDVMSVAYPNFEDWRAGNRSFDQLAAFRFSDFNLTGSGEPERVWGRLVSASFFSILGAKPALGRSFLPQEDQLGATPVAVLAHELWQRRYGADPHVLGKTIMMNGTAYAVVGVLPEGFRFYGQPSVYVPIGQWTDMMMRGRDIHPGITVLGRLKAGATLAQARQDLAGLARHLAEAYPKTNAGHGVNIAPLEQDILGDIRPTLLLLLGAVSFVLLIACANVANLMLARATGRLREFAIRAALGASRQRVVRQLLTESVLLAVAGGTLGVLVASWGTSVVLAAVPVGLPRAEAVHMDGRVLAFALVVSILTGILFGLAPALQGAGSDLQETLKEGGRGASGARHRVQNLFVISELALALVLLVGAGLMIRTIWSLWAVNPGFDPHNVLTFSLALSPAKSTDPSQIRVFYQQLVARLKTVPGVQYASPNLFNIPLSGDDNEFPFWLEGQPRPASQDKMIWALAYLVGGDYQGALRIPLLKGRFITDQDREKTRPVVVIDQVMADSLFPGQDPIGKHLNIEWLGPVEIVGVVGHVTHWGLDSDARARIRYQLYMPFLQIPDQFMTIVRTASVVVRTSTDPLATFPSIRHEVYGTGNDTPVYDVQTMEQIISNSLAYRQFLRLLLVIFAAAALVLAGVGIYGLISYSVSQRAHEIGIRMALGAGRAEVLRMVVGQGMMLALAGIGVGLAAALGLAHLLSSVLFGVRPSDFLTLAAVSAVLGSVALAATFLPARRATRVDPMVVLRYQ